MRPDWLWDRDISTEEIQKVLKDPHDNRFVSMAALVLSRNNAPKEIFTQYLDRTIFVENWARVKRQMRKNAWDDQRIIFWQAVYAKLASEFKEKGIAIRPVKEPEKADDEWSRQIAGMIKDRRQDMGLTQSEFARRIGISQQIISRVEKGRNDMRLLTMVKVFQFLGERVLIDSTSTWVSGKISDGNKEITNAKRG